MDRDTEATLHRKNMRAESDKMTTNGRIEDLVRQFMILPKEHDVNTASLLEKGNTHFAK
jgi:hypothetical protein